MYILRLDDASEYRDFEKWRRMAELLRKHNIKPIFGVIPDCKDPELMKYPKDESFWDTAQQWICEGWTPAMHGYQHLFKTCEGGLNPVNKFSEFAGVPYEEQAEQITKGYAILKSHKIITEIFFAPAHTYDNNTLKALYENTDIRIISDTVANDVYYKDGFYYIPQQSGCVRELPFKIATFCYHPNTMSGADFDQLEYFLVKHKSQFINFPSIHFTNRKRSLYDLALQILYRFRVTARQLKK